MSRQARGSFHWAGIEPVYYTGIRTVVVGPAISSHGPLLTVRDQFGGQTLSSRELPRDNSSSGTGAIESRARRPLGGTTDRVTD